jgi:hypothetical protein
MPCSEFPLGETASRELNRLRETQSGEFQTVIQQSGVRRLLSIRHARSPSVPYFAKIMSQQYPPHVLQLPLSGVPVQRVGKLRDSLARKEKKRICDYLVIDAALSP